MDNKLATVFECSFTDARPKGDWSSDRTAAWASERAFFTGTAGYSLEEYLFAKEKQGATSDEMLQDEAARRLGFEGVPDKSQARSIAEYMTRFNTLGAFNLGGVMTQAELDEWQRGIKATGSNIWHGYLSIPPSLSVNVSPDDMQRLCRATFGKFLDDAGFARDNIALLCVAHGDTDHAHFHYCFYEKEPRYLDKYGRAQYRWRGKVSQEAIDNYRLSTTAYIDEHKEDYFCYRDIVTSLMRGGVAAPSDALLMNELRELKVMLPRKGRLGYGSDNMAELRFKIDNIALMLLKRNPEAYAQHKKALREIARRGKELAELKHTNDNYVKTLTADYKARLGNVVIKLVRQMQFDPRNKYARPSREKSKGSKLSSARRKQKAGARCRRQNNLCIVDAVIRSLSAAGNVRTDFTYELHKAEAEIEQAKRGVK